MTSASNTNYRSPSTPGIGPTVGIVVLVLFLISACATNPASINGTSSTPSRLVQEKIDKIEALVEQLGNPDNGEEGQDLEMKLVGYLDQLGKLTKDSDIRFIEEHARQNKESLMAWPMARVLILLGSYDVAVEVIVVALRDAEDPMYRMWKWWEHSFGELESYPRMSAEIGRAFLAHFDRDPGSRELIQKLFHMSMEELRTKLQELEK